MPRFLLPPDAWDQAELTGDEAKHLAQVLRIKNGSTITVFDGLGRQAQAEVKEARRDRVTLQIGEPSTSSPPLPQVTLAQAIPKGKNMELIVQKAVELGVSTIQPLITQRTVVQPGDGKAEKWRRIALEACKQCGQDTLPQINDPISYGDWIRSNQTDDLAIIASLAEGARPMRDVVRAQPDLKTCSLLVGPEGDFTDEETQLAITAGFQPVTLGDIVLRVETATLYTLSALRYEFS